MTAYQQIASNKRRTVILIVLFVIFIIVLGGILGETMEFGYGGLIFAVPIALGMSLFSYYSGDKVALWTAGAKGPITKEDNAYVYRLVENMTITAGLPMPKVYLIPDAAPNAFATGRDPKHASIAMTTGIVEMLENEELEGVIAHELAHIKNYDIRLMMIVIVCVGIVTLLTDFFFRWSFFGGRRRGGRDQGGAILLVIGIAAMIIAPIVAKIIQLAISRKREYLADASAVLLTRYPEGLARALEKISGASQPLKHARQATAHLYINNPFGNSKKFFSKLLSTHPPLQERVAALRKMA